MRHRKFVVTTTVMMLTFAAVVAGLAFYSSHVATASISNLPHAAKYLPAGAEGVFGINVQKFVQSPVYKRFESKQGERIGTDLQEFIARTGVDPRRDVQYIVAAGKSGTDHKGEGVVIAVGTFNTAAIISYINTKGTPIEVPYKKGKVLMMPESDGTKLEKGIAFLDESDIALGDLESLKQVLDVQSGDAPGIETTNLGMMLKSINPEEMFWFAGDATSVLAKAPVNNPLAGNLSTIRTIFGTLDMTDAIKGKITATANTVESAQKLADVVRGFVALGQLAASNNPNQELQDLAKQIVIQISTSQNTVNLSLDVPYDVLDKLEQLKSTHSKI